MYCTRGWIFQVGVSFHRCPRRLKRVCPGIFIEHFQLGILLVLFPDVKDYQIVLIFLFFYGRILGIFLSLDFGRELVDFAHQMIFLPLQLRLDIFSLVQMLIDGDIFGLYFTNLGRCDFS